MKRRQARNVWQITPVSLYDIPGVERWLEEQANRGLFPLHLGQCARFDRTGVPGTRFRLEPFGKEKEPTQEQLELYGNAGWTYAMPVGKAYFLFYAADPEAPELYTDFAARGMSLDRLVKRVRIARMIPVLYPLLLFLLVFGVFAFLPASRFDAQPNRWGQLPLALLSLFSPMSLMFAFGCIFLGVTTFRNYRILAATHHNLQNGLPPPPPSGPSRRIRRENLMALTLIPLLYLTWFCMYFDVGQTVPLENFRRPYVALEQLERAQVVRYDELFGENPFPSHRDENVVRREFSLLAPVWYTVEEEVYETGPGSENSFSPVREPGCRYAPRMEMVRLRLLIPTMARTVAEAELDHLRLINLWWEYEEAEVPGLDFAILARESSGTFQMAALGRGGWVAVFRYGGEEDLRNHLDLLASMVTQDAAVAP